MRFAKFAYDRVAFLYDEVSAVYSLGAIARSKRHHLGFLRPGDRVLYVGVGRGVDALAAARAGAAVTAIDLSESMLRRLRAAVANEGLRMEIIQDDVSRLPVGGEYDVVVANYFLNLFSEPDARSMLEILLGHLRPGGQLCLADFAPVLGGGYSGSGGLGGLVTTIYYRVVNFAGWLLGICALHEIPDLPGWLTAQGLEIIEIARFPVLGHPAPAYWTLVAKHRGPEESTPLNA